jgi:hypothetical protein
MTKRSVAAIIIFSIITCGIYTWYWFIATKDEMNAQGANIPTAWIWLVPFASLYWLWKWSEGVEHVTRGKSAAAVNFLLVLFLGGIGMAIIQSTFNNTVEERGRLPQARIA